MTTIQLRRGTAAEWKAANPVLAQGEPGLETDTGHIKIGDGSTHWVSLAYDTTSPTAVTDSSPTQGGQAGEWNGSGWIENGGAPATPEAFGATGDGTTDDTTALQSWLASGKHVALTPGKTYRYRRTLTVSTTGQVIQGNGAVLLPVDQASTTTSTTVTSGSTNQITVASAAGFEVSDRIFLAQGTIYSRMHTIRSISGNTITIGDTFDVNFSGTTNVYLSLVQLSLNADDVDVSGVIFDGNSPNWPVGFWGVTAGVLIYQHKNAHVHHCWIRNQPGDGAATANSQHAVFEDNYLENIGGRGFSYGGDGSGEDVGNRCLNNWFYRTELNPNGHLSPGGAGSDGHGAINFSGGGLDCETRGNHIDTSIEGIGRWRLAFGSNPGGHQFTDNVVKNCSSYGFTGEGQPGRIGMSSTPAVRTILRGNQFYSTRGIKIEQAATNPGFPHDWILEGNICWETPVLISRLNRMSIANNLFGGADNSITLVSINNAGSTVGCAGFTVNGNIFYQGQTGLQIDQYCTQIGVDGRNIFVGQSSCAIATTHADASVVIANNTIQATSNSGTNYVGILATGLLQLIANDIDITAGASFSGISVDATGTGVYLQGNRVRRGSAGHCVVIASGAAATHLKGNKLDGGYSDSGTGTIVEDNWLNWATRGAKQGTFTLNGTTAVNVSTGEVRTGDLVMIWRLTANGTPGNITLGTITDGSGFQLQSDSSSDLGTGGWRILH